MHPRLKWLAALAALTVLATCCYVWWDSRGEGKVAVEFVEVVERAPFPAQRIVGGRWVPTTNFYRSPMLRITNGTRTAITGFFTIETGTDGVPLLPSAPGPKSWDNVLNLAAGQSTNVYRLPVFNNFHNEQNYWLLRVLFMPDTKLRQWRWQLAQAAYPRSQRLAKLLVPACQRAHGPLMWNMQPVPQTNSPPPPH